MDKRRISFALDLGGLLPLDLALRGPDVVVAVNYHGTPPDQRALFERHCMFYRQHFECLDEDGLLRFLRGERALRRPGLVLSFDDGLRSNVEVAAPLLDAYGLRGWFMVPGGFIEASDPRAFFLSRILEHPDPAQADAAGPPMTWAGARSLAARGHVIGCHGWGHLPLGPQVDEGVVEEEVAQAQRRLQERIGRRVRTFCWVRGRVEHYSARAHAAVGRSFDLAFMTMSRAIHRGDDPLVLHRCNVEASYPLAQVRFQISRLNELYFRGRRRAVAQALGLAG